MRQIYLLFLLVGSPMVFGQSLTLDWANNVGGPNYDYVFDIALDDSSNSYTTGTFYGTIDFDPGPGTYNLTSNGQTDPYLLKLDADGNFLWARSFGSTTYESSKSLTVDANGDVLLTGSYQAPMDVDPGPGVTNLSFSGYSDMYIVKFSAAGDLIWGHGIGGTITDNGHGVICDSSSNVYVAGNFTDSVDFDPGPANYDIVSPVQYNAYVLKLDALGNFVWVRHVENWNGIFAQEITLDSELNVIVGGELGDICDFDPGPGVSNVGTALQSGFFVLKLDNSGDFLWASGFGANSSGAQEMYRMTTDASGNIYSAGYYEDSADFDPSPAAYYLPGDYRDGFVHKLDSAGNFVWAQGISGPGYDLIHSVYVDVSGNVYLTGSFEGTADLDPTSGVDIRTATSSYMDMFIVKLDSMNNFIFAENIGAGFATLGHDLEVDSTNAIRIAGIQNGYTVLDPFNPVIFPGIGSIDPFVARYTQCYDHSIDVVNSCGPYTWTDGNTYTTSGSYSFSSVNISGCDSTVVLDLTVYSATQSDTTVAACGVDYTWNGTTYTTPGTYTFTTTNGSGCDSIASLNLTLNNTTTGTDIQTACESFTWIDGITYTSNTTSATWVLPNASGCDSLVTLNLTLNSNSASTDVQTACNSFAWIDGVTYTASNTSATWVVPNASGCDSTITLDLTINTVDAGVTQLDALLTADEPGANYQWLNCPAMTEISGATSQSYTALSNGDYAVVVTQNGCTDTSACYTVTGLGIAENDFGEGLLLYPNPSQGDFTVNLGEQYAKVVLTLSDVNGKQVQSTRSYDAQIVQMFMDEPAGSYVLVIEAGDKRAVLQVVVE